MPAERWKVSIALVHNTSWGSKLDETAVEFGCAKDGLEACGRSVWEQIPENGWKEGIV